MTTKTLHPAAIAAADWWAEQVTGTPLFRATVPGEPGAGPMELAGALASVLADRHQPAEGAGELFAALLAERIDAQIKAQLKYRADVYVSLHVDYGPDFDLAEIAEAAGISLSRFPWKTHQWIHLDYVTAALGYRAPARLIWAAEGWQRPTCPEHRWDGDGRQVTDELCGLPQYHEGDHEFTRTDERTCSGCGLTYAGHHNRDRDRTTAAEWHVFETAAEVTA